MNDPKGKEGDGIYRMLARLKKKTSELKNQVFALYLVYKKKETPILAKAVTIIIVAYTLSALDLIPDFIPILGYLDDVIIIPLGITLALKLIPSQLMELCKKEADEMNRDEIPEAKIATIIITILWGLTIGVIGYKIVSYI